MSTQALWQLLEDATNDSAMDPRLTAEGIRTAREELDALEKELEEARTAVLGPGGWKDVLTVETILRERAEADLKKARQEIATLTESLPAPAPRG